MDRNHEHVLHLIDTGGPGGAETVFSQLAASFPRDLGAPVAVVSREGWLAERLRDRGLTPIAVNPKGSFSLRYLWALVRLIRGRRVRVVIAHLLGSMLYGGIAGRLTGVPVIGVVHGQTDLSTSRHARLKNLLVRHAVDHVVYVSEPLREEINAQLRLPLERTSVITNAVDMQRFTPGTDGSLRGELGVPDGTFLVGAIGNIRSPKGYNGLLHAWRHVVDAGLPAQLVIVGEGHGTLLQELTTLRSTLGLDAHVTFAGLRSDVVNVLRSLDLLVSSSTTEGFSIVCVEAMACGVPVVATRSGGPESIIDDGESGLLVPARDPQALASGILRALRDPALRSSLIGNGRAQAERRFGSERQVSEYEGIARRLLDRATRGSVDKGR